MQAGVPLGKGKAQAPKSEVPARGERFPMALLAHHQASQHGLRGI